MHVQFDPKELEKTFRHDLVEVVLTVALSGVSPTGILLMARIEPRDGFLKLLLGGETYKMFAYQRDEGRLEASLDALNEFLDNCRKAQRGMAGRIEALLAKLRAL